MNGYAIPTVVESTPRGDRVSDVYSRLLSERIVFVGTPIDDGVANVVIAQILHLAGESSSHDIHLYLNSPGGSFSAMMAVYDTMQYAAPDVATLCVGQATSTAAILLAAGAPGKRAVLPHSRVLLHQPHAELTRGSISDLALEAAELARVREEAEAVLARHTGRTVEEIRDDTDRALVLAGVAAVHYGVADRMVGDGGSGGAELEPGALLRPGP
jgi:ATP-dependent Clp protease protease subunit